MLENWSFDFDETLHVVRSTGVTAGSALVPIPEDTELTDIGNTSVEPNPAVPMEIEDVDGQSEPLREPSLSNSTAPSQPATPNIPLAIPDGDPLGRPLAIPDGGWLAAQDRALGRDRSTPYDGFVSCEYLSAIPFLPRTNT